MSPTLVDQIGVQRFLILDIPKLPSTEETQEKSLSIIVYGNKFIAVLQLEYIKLSMTHKI